MSRLVYMEPDAYQCEAVALYLEANGGPATVQHPVVTLIFEGQAVAQGMKPEETQVVLPIFAIESVLDIADQLRIAAQDAMEAGSDIDAVGEVRISVSTHPAD